MRLLHLAAALSLILGGSILGARGIGDQIPISSLWAAMFTNPDGSRCESPCLFGVRLGVTNWEGGIQILQAHPYLTQLRPDYIVEDYTLTFGTVRLKVSAPGTGLVVFLDMFGVGPFYSVYLGLDASTSTRPGTLGGLTMGAIVATLGPPEFIDLTDNLSNPAQRGPTIHLYYASRRTLFSCLVGSVPFSQLALGEHLEIGKPTCTMSILSANAALTAKRAVAWHGFTTIRNYPLEYIGP